MYFKCGPNEEIKYVDVCSLYPWVNKYGKYPIGHPKVLVGEECKTMNLSETDGLIKCKILPPQNLYHPVLPVKMNDKLMFVLCRTCGKDMNQEECNHNEEERSLTGTWVIDEVLKALEKGYKVIDIYEIWKYAVEQYDPQTRTGGLFTDYINNFLKIKQQSSGYPSTCNTSSEQEEYVKDYLEKEGVVLDTSKIAVNPGLRQLGKAVITSFWGKLGQRENQPKTSIVKEPDQFFSMLTNPSIHVNNVLAVDEKCLVVNWEHREESYDILHTVNVCLAAYTTAQARLKLYSYLERLGDRVMYFDTDSVIYVSRPDEYDVPLGTFLGEMTDEVEGYGPGSYISEFVSGGPKNYAYKVFSTKDNMERVVCKVKGICLNYEASKLVNFDLIRDMVLKHSDPVYVTSKNIRRTKEHEIVTRSETKIYRLNFTKRKATDDYDSVPYGYKKRKLDV